MANYNTGWATRKNKTATRLTNKNPGGQPGGTPPIIDIPDTGWNQTMGQTSAGGGSTSYLTEAQREKVERLLGDKYDPTKALNVQLFKARWASADQEQRRAMAKRLAAQWIEGGPSAKTLGGFHREYIAALQAENQQKAKELQQKIADYSQNFGGWATTPEAGAASVSYWTDFANTPEGQAHIAGTGMTTEEWIQNQTQSVSKGILNFQKQQEYWSGVQRTAAALGQEVPGFKPPGWESTLEAIRAGAMRVPTAGGPLMSMYPGIAADLAGIDPNLYQGPAATARRHRLDNQAGEGGASGAAPGGPNNAATMPYYSFANGAHPSITGFDYDEMVGDVFQ